MKKIFTLSTYIFIAFFSNAQLHIGPGINWKSSAGTYVVLDNIGLKHDATSASLDNIFTFTGTTNVLVSGTTLPLFTNVNVALSGSSKIILQRSISISQNLSFQSGLVDLNNNNIDLGTTGSLIGESETARIIGAAGGYIQAIKILNAPASVNPGNLGAVITSAQNLGSTTIRRGHVAQTDVATPNFSIQRYYDITPTTNTSLNATLRINYFDAELNGKTEANLSAWKSTDNINWSYAGFSTRNAASNFVEANTIASFSRWTLSDKFATGIFDLPNGRNSLQVWPNPFIEWITVAIESTKPTKANLQVFNMLGQIVYTQPLSILMGKNIFPVKIAAFAKGVYQLKITGNDGSSAVVPVMKQ
ncbi:MAG: T9SS type A sorting domain-containing protein [Sphingobacteriales bacterium]|nr:T9SS type A sorting domain-containing protein [Sphingobacteriales bacterium]